MAGNTGAIRASEATPEATPETTPEATSEATNTATEVERVLAGEALTPGFRIGQPCSTLACSTLALLKGGSAGGNDVTDAPPCLLLLLLLSLKAAKTGSLRTRQLLARPQELDVDGAGGRIHWGEARAIVDAVRPGSAPAISPPLHD